MASINRCRMPRDSSTTEAFRFSAQADHLEIAVDLGGPPMAGHPVAGREQVEELPDQEVLVDRREIGHEADEPADVLGVLADVDRP